MATRTGGSRTTKAAKGKPKTAGQRLTDEMGRDQDSFSVRLLIEQAADIADVIERLRGLINGEVSEWASLKLGPQVVQVVIDEPVKRRRELSTELRHLLAEIHRQRANIPLDADDDDDPAKKY